MSACPPSLIPMRPTHTVGSLYLFRPPPRNPRNVSLARGPASGVGSRGEARQNIQGAIYGWGKSSIVYRLYCWMPHLHSRPSVPFVAACVPLFCATPSHRWSPHHDNPPNSPRATDNPTVPRGIAVGETSPVAFARLPSYRAHLTLRCWELCFAACKSLRDILFGDENNVIIISNCLY